MLVVDVDPEILKYMEEDAEDSKKEEEEEEVVVSSPRTDGMDQKDIEDHKVELARLQMEYKELVFLISKHMIPVLIIRL